MKSIDEIEGLSFDALERIADDSSVSTPDSLKEDIGNAIAAAALADGGRKSTPRRFPIPALAGTLATAAAALAILLTLPENRSPKDTFDNPEEAYAQLEQTLAYISGKVDKGMGLADEAGDILEKTTETARLQLTAGSRDSGKGTGSNN